MPIARIDNIVGSCESLFGFWLQYGFPLKDAIVFIFFIDDDFAIFWGVTPDFDLGILGDWKLIDDDYLVSHIVLTDDLVSVLPF